MRPGFQPCFDLECLRRAHPSFILPVFFYPCAWEPNVGLLLSFSYLTWCQNQGKGFHPVMSDFVFLCRSSRWELNSLPFISGILWAVVWRLRWKNLKSCSESVCHNWIIISMLEGYYDQVFNSSSALHFTWPSPVRRFCALIKEENDQILALRT